MSNASSELPDRPSSRGPLTAWWLAPVSLLAVFGAFVVAQLFGGIVLYLYPMSQHWSAARMDDWVTHSVGAQFVYVLIADGLIVAAIAGLLKWFRWDWATIGLKRPKLVHIGAGMLAAVPYYLLYIAIAVIIGALVPALDVDQKQQIGFESVHGVFALTLAFVSLVVVPPLVEEIAVRGFLYSGVRKMFPKVISAVIVSAVFGAAHLAEGGAAGPLWIGALDTFVLSLVLVYLREKTGNLWAGITLHAVKNGVAFVSLFILSAR